MTALSDQSIQTCSQKSLALTQDTIKKYLTELDDWQLTKEHGILKIFKSYSFKNFLSATHFANNIAALAETENHHPRICIEWGKVSLTWWTHSISGLFINDFIMAARCEKAYKDSE